MLVSGYCSHYSDSICHNSVPEIVPQAVAGLRCWLSQGHFSSGFCLPSAWCCTGPSAYCTAASHEMSSCIEVDVIRIFFLVKVCAVKSQVFNGRRECSLSRWISNCNPVAAGMTWNRPCIGCNPLGMVSIEQESLNLTFICGVVFSHYGDPSGWNPSQDSEQSQTRWTSDGDWGLPDICPNILGLYSVESNLPHMEFAISVSQIRARQDC